MRSEGLYPLGERLEGVPDPCPHGRVFRGLPVLPGVGDVMDGAVELPLIPNNVARLPPPILVPLDKELAELRDGGEMCIRDRGRLVTYLSAQALEQGSSSFSIPFDRQQRADYLGVDRSALSKELGRMRDEGLLETRKNHFLLHRLGEGDS